MQRLTWKMPDGSWGVNGVDVSALSPMAYAAMYKLMRLEDMQEGDLMPILRDSCDKVCGFVDDRRRSECGDCPIRLMAARLLAVTAEHEALKGSYAHLIGGQEP